MVFEKAVLEIEDAEPLTCLYNPDSLNLTRSSQWKAATMPGKGVPHLMYAGSDSGTMKLDLVFDTTATGTAVTTHTNRLIALMDVDPSKDSGNPDQNGRPPTVVFRWGDMHSFPAVATNLSLQFTYFSSVGVPLRAKVSLDLKQFRGEGAYGPQNPTSGTPRPQRSHRIKPGETLDRISAHYYGDATRWRLLADANGLHDPLALQAGRVINVPRPDGT